MWKEASFGWSFPKTCGAQTFSTENFGFVSGATPDDLRPHTWSLVPQTPSPSQKYGESLRFFQLRLKGCPYLWRHRGDVSNSFDYRNANSWSFFYEILRSCEAGLISAIIIR